MPLFEFILSFISIYLLVVLIAGVHVLLYKRDSRAALGWLGLIILFPIAGALLYSLFGVNRISRKARRISLRVAPEGGRALIGLQRPAEADARNVGFSITGKHPETGHKVRVFYNGEQAFPPMLQAIEQAQHEVLLSSYIFDNDETGRSFVAAMAAARSRGVQVRVLVDDVGLRYSFPTIIRELKAARLPYRKFMPLKLIPPSFSLNLRTHRKLLITDRKLVFAGGMNIGDRQLVDGPSPHRASDLHFLLAGPVVTNCVELFAEDWAFSSGAALQADLPASTWNGTAEARLISDGPDETLDSLLLVIMGVIARAKKRVWIMSPYFLPEPKFQAALCTAALAGVDIKIMIPQDNNWPVVQWALQHSMGALLNCGIGIFQRPPPFAHSKCLLVDDNYVLVGSANLDPRSLRLNFELGIEIFDQAINRQLADHFSEVLSSCRPWNIQRLQARGTLARLRDATAALFSPYL